MGEGVEVRTERLLLRRWRPEDIEPFAALNADPVVMEHFPSTLTREETERFVAGIEAHWDAYGLGLWAMEVLDSGSFLGFTGLAVPRFEAAFTPTVEVGWRMARFAWGSGYASEAARAALAFGFERHGLPEIVSFTSTTNERSQAVMRRIGLHRDPADDFDHPAVPEGHRLRRHVLYRLTADEWRGRTR